MRKLASLWHGRISSASFPWPIQSAPCVPAREGGSDLVVKGNSQLSATGTSRGACGNEKLSVTGTSRGACRNEKLSVTGTAGFRWQESQFSVTRKNPSFCEREHELSATGNTNISMTGSHTSTDSNTKLPVAGTPSYQ